MRYVLSLMLPLMIAATVGLSVSQPSGALTTAVSPKFEPPDGSILSGVAANQQAGDTVETAKAKWDEWTRLMGGKRTNISHTFEGFDTWFGYDYDVADARGAMPLISWQTGSTAPKTIAQAGNTSSGKPTDQVLLQNAKLSVDYGKPAFVRVDQEMNAHWFPWSSYNPDGTRRASSPEDFRDMWRRMAVVFDGGRVGDMNAKLAALGMPPLDADATFPEWMNMPSTTDPNGYVEPASNVAFVFNPVDAPGIPDVTGNRWLDYYPGDAYVDWVGQTTYNATWNATTERRFGWMDAFYEEFSAKRGKPYMMGEWGLEPEANSGFGDNPSYVEDVLRWAKARPKVKALVYFSVLEGKGDYRLSSYPQSAKTLASALKQDGYFDTTASIAPRDVVVPDTSISSGPSGTVRTNSASFAFVASEASKFRCSLDGAAFSDCASPKSYSALASRTHTFRVAAVDAAGNVDPTPATRTWTVDRILPTVTYTTPAQGSRTSDRTPAISAVVKDSQTNLAKSNIKVFLDGRQIGASTFSYNTLTDKLSFTAPSLSYASHSVRVEARDAAGNVASKAWSFYVVR